MKTKTSIKCVRSIIWLALSVFSCDGTTDDHFDQDGSPGTDGELLDCASSCETYLQARHDYDLSFCGATLEAELERCQSDFCRFCGEASIPSAALNACLTDYVDWGCYSSNEEAVPPSCRALENDYLMSCGNYSSCDPLRCITDVDCLDKAEPNKMIWKSDYRYAWWDCSYGSCTISACHQDHCATEDELKKIICVSGTN